MKESKIYSNMHRNTNNVKDESKNVMSNTINQRANVLKDTGNTVSSISPKVNYKNSEIVNTANIQNIKNDSIHNVNQTIPINKSSTPKNISNKTSNEKINKITNILSHNQIPKKEKEKNE